MPRDRKLGPGSLPHQVGYGLTDKQSGAHGVHEPKLGTWATVVKAAQGNFDHLMGVLRDLVKSHNSLVDDFEDLRDYAVAGLGDTVDPDHAHDGTSDAGGVVDHGALTGLGDDDHPQYLTPAEHTAVGDSAPHHAAVTVGTGLDVTGQDVTLDLSEVAAGGELGGFMDAPTVDATHAGSAHHATPDAEPTADAHIADASAAHAASAVSADSTTLVGVGTDVQAVLEELDDAIVAAAHPNLATHDALGLATDAELATHAGAPDPHTGYQKESEKSAASGYASLDAGTKVPTAELGGAGASAAKYLRGDQSWATPAGSGGGDDTYSWFIS